MLALLLLAGGAASAVEPGLAGHWSFDEFNAIHALDGSGAGHHAGLFGAPQMTAGRVGQGLIFGPNDFMDVPHNADMNSTEQLSVEFWIRPGPEPKPFPLFSKGSMTKAWDLYFDPPAGMNLRLGGSAPQYDHVIRGVLTTGQWTHVAWVFDSTQAKQSLKVYINGEMKQTWDCPGKLLTNRKPLVFGRGGALDEVRMYNVALTADVVRQHFAQPEKLLGREVVVLRVRPVKLWNKPAEKVRLETAVESLAASAKECKVRMFLEYGVDRKIPLQETAITLAPGEVKEFTIEWPAGELRWGFDFVTEVCDASGKLLDRKSDTFFVTRNPYQVGQKSGTAMWGWDEAATQRAREHAVFVRRNYLPLTELMGVNPDNFGKCVPDTDKWYAGQGSAAYANSREGVAALVDACHALGIAIVPYSMSYTSGYYGTKIATEHPDWMAYLANGRFTSGLETRILELMGAFYRHYPQSLEDKALLEAIRKPDAGAGLSIATVNLANKEAMRFHAEQVLAGMKFFKWDGLRWDGHAQVGGPGDPVAMGIPPMFDFDGKPIVPDMAERDRMSAENTRMLKELILKELPDVVFGYNWGLEYAKHGKQRPLDYAECCKDGGMILWESVNRIHAPTSPWHRWKDVADTIADEVEYPKQNGGTLNVGWFPWWLAKDVYAHHLLSVILAARAHLSGAPEFGLSPWFRLAARYSELLYDPAMNRSPEWKQRISVQPAVWWEKYVYERKTAQGVDVLVHLVNPPATEFVVIDGIQEPTIKRDLQVTMKLPAGPPKAVWLISPDLDPQARKLDCSAQGQNLTVVVPELKYWDLLVFQF
ncbi:MAG: LamG domain-containing protein [Kiritimatiellae bacterium]|nr:LamG domain-containing protein [Kiritimatiellia bacterium]